MKYKFEQFNTIITDPIITADETTINLNPKNNTISVYISLKTDSSKLYGVHLIDVAVSNLNYEGYDNLMVVVMNKLKEFEI